MKSYLIILIALLNTSLLVAQSSNKSKAIIKYQIGLNGTVDRSLVQRVILFSQNRATIVTPHNKLEPMLNYKFGHVTPNGRPRLNLENDITALVENQFIQQYKIFPAAIAGFETSPYLRKLNTRWVAGAGAGTYFINTPQQNAQLNLYSFYEQSNFEIQKFNGLRIMPSIKGRHSFKQNKFGVIYAASYASAFNNSNDYRIRAMLKPYVKLTKKIDFTLLYDIWYEGIAETNQPKEISIFNFGFTYANN